MKKTEPLGNGIHVVTSDIHKFSTDTILLADFSQPKANETAIELGCGCGAATLIWNREFKTKHTTAVDIQTDACDLLSESVALNNLTDTITVINTDMRNLKGPDYAGQFDLVACNPPYKEKGSGIENPNEGKKTARHEDDITLNEIVLCAAYLLKFSGRFCLCQRAQRLCDVIEAFRLAKIEPKRLRFVQQRQNKAPKFFLIEGKRGGQRGGLIIEPTLFVEDETGDFSPEMKKIYGTYKSYKYE